MTAAYVPGRPRAYLAGLPRPDRALVMGVLNVTPDSFSDGGRHDTFDTALAHGRAMTADGADIIDVGGESTRPGAGRPDEATEQARVVPVVRALSDAGIVVSVDTMRAAVAEAALDAGATVVNDVSGGLADPQMAELIAARRCPFIAMHWRAHSDTMQDHTHYDDVVTDVAAALHERVEALLEAGVRPEQLAIDPGLGFSKTGQQNWDLLAGLDALFALDLPVLVGASRKTFLGALLADSHGAPRPPAQRDAATAAITALSASAGAWAIRVHDVRPSADAVRVARAWHRK